MLQDSQTNVAKGSRPRLGKMPSSASVRVVTNVKVTT